MAWAISVPAIWAGQRQGHVDACRHTGGGDIFAVDDHALLDGRGAVDVRIDEGALHEVYLPHFKRAADEGVAGIMAAYNSVNGTWAGQNEYLLTQVLRDQWRWDGITVSDFIFGLRDAAASLNAGLDLEEPFAQQRATHLRAQIGRARPARRWCSGPGYG